MAGFTEQFVDAIEAMGKTDKELADAKTYITGSFPMAFSSNAGIANQMNSFQRVGLPIGYIVKRNALGEVESIDPVSDDEPPKR